MSLMGQIRGTVEDIVREILADVVERLDQLEARLKALEDKVPEPKTASTANATRAKASTATAKGSGS